MSNTTITFVETKMRKTEVCFTSTFSGISGFPNEVGYFTSSPKVELDGKLWAIRLYPGGYDDASSGFVSCFLSLESMGHARASFKITVLNQKGWKDHQYCSDAVKDFRNIETATVTWGQANFLPHNLLKSSSNGICVDDKLIIRVSLTIYGEIEEITKSSVGSSTVSSLFSSNSMPGSPARSRSIIDDLRSAVMESTLSDVTIFCGEESLAAHKFILTLRSPVFRAMLTGELAEATANEIVITDFDAPVMRAFLNYLYTDQVPLKELEAYGELLLAAACKYEVPGLEALCENHLCAALNTSNVINVLYIADLYNAKRLKQRALMFIGSHGKDVVQEEGFFQNLSMTLYQEVIMVLAGVSPEHQKNSITSPDRSSGQLASSSASPSFKLP